MNIKRNPIIFNMVGFFILFLPGTSKYLKGFTGSKDKIKRPNNYLSARYDALNLSIMSTGELVIREKRFLILLHQFTRRHSLCNLKINLLRFRSVRSACPRPATALNRSQKDFFRMHAYAFLKKPW